MNSDGSVSSFFNKKKILNVSFGFIIGLGLGLFIKDIFLWRRTEEGYLQEILREMFDLKSNINKLQKKIKKIDYVNKNIVENKNNSAFIDNLESDVFQDARSFLDDSESFYSTNEGIHEECENFITELDEILRDPSSENYERCYDLCYQNSWKFQDIGEFLWRFAMVSYRTTLILNFDQQNKVERIFSAFSLALNSVRRSPQSSEAHKWLAILYGVTGLLSDNQKKILNGYKFKEHIDKCLELNSNDAYAYLLKGRFCFQVSNLAFYERKLASLLFATPPNSTVEEALECFHRCEELSPNIYAENHYYIAQCYKYLGDYAQSAKWIETAKLIPLTVFDNEIQMKLQDA